MTRVHRVGTTVEVRMPDEGWVEGRVTDLNPWNKPEEEGLMEVLLEGGYVCVEPGSDIRWKGQR